MDFDTRIENLSRSHRWRFFSGLIILEMVLIAVSFDMIVSAFIFLFGLGMGVIPAAFFGVQIWHILRTLAVGGIESLLLFWLIAELEVRL